MQYMSVISIFISFTLYIYICSYQITKISLKLLHSQHVSNFNSIYVDPSIEATVNNK